MGSAECVELEAKLVPRNFVRNRGSGRWYIETFWVLEECNPSPKNGFVVEGFDGTLPRLPNDLADLLQKRKGGLCKLRTRQATEEDELTETVDESEETENEPEPNLSDKAAQAMASGQSSETEQVKPAKSEAPPASLNRTSTHKTPKAPPPTPEAEKEEANEGDGVELLSLVFPFEEGEPIGVVVDEHMNVVKVQAGTVSEGLVMIGDVVMKLNGRPVTTADDFYRLVPRCFPTLRIDLKRDPEHQRKLEALRLPEHLEKITNRRPGHDYLVVDVDCVLPTARPLGMAVDTLHNKVIVTKLVGGAASEAGLKIYDRIVAIDATPVSDKDVAKRMILDRGGRFQGLIERATETAIVDAIKLSIQQKSCLPVAPENEAWASFDMPADVRDIAKSERARRRSKERIQAAKTVLHRVPSREHRPITIAADHREVEICSDIDPTKQLRKPTPI